MLEISLIFILSLSPFFTSGCAPIPEYFKTNAWKTKFPQILRGYSAEEFATLIDAAIPKWTTFEGTCTAVPGNAEDGVKVAFYAHKFFCYAECDCKNPKKIHCSYENGHKTDPEELKLLCHCENSNGCSHWTKISWNDVLVNQFPPIPPQPGTTMPPPVKECPFNAIKNRGSCYELIKTPKNFEEARSYCRDVKGGRLAFVQENALALKLDFKYDLTNYKICHWIGLINEGVNKWYWIGKNNNKVSTDAGHLLWPGFGMRDFRLPYPMPTDVCGCIKGMAELNGFVETEQCNTKMPFFCQYSENTVTTFQACGQGYELTDVTENLKLGDQSTFDKTLEQCKTLCANHQLCLSFAYDEGDKKCTLYPKQIVDLLYKIDHKAASFVVLYDKCNGEGGCCAPLA